MTDALPPIDRRLAAREVPPAGTTVIVDADPAQRAALAQAADVPAVNALHAELRIVPWSDDGFSVTGRVTADLVQICGVTLEPIDTRVDEPVDVRLVPPEAMAKWEPKPNEDGEIDLDAATLDLPEPFEDDVLDLGNLIVEHFLVGIDPYPRRPGAVFDAAAAGVDPASDRLSAFAALAALKKDGPGS